VSVVVIGSIKNLTPLAGIEMGFENFAASRPPTVDGSTTNRDQPGSERPGSDDEVMRAGRGTE
jgi:hypothetical protein